MEDPGTFLYDEQERTGTGAMSAPDDTGRKRRHMIEFIETTKVYGRSDRAALDHLNLKVGDGCVYGFLGPNGAGKTTTISMLSTVLLPSSGEIYIDGNKLTRAASEQKRKLAVITQEYSMRQDMTMDEVMEYQGRLYYMPRK